MIMEYYVYEANTTYWSHTCTRAFLQNTALLLCTKSKTIPYITGASVMKIGAFAVVGSNMDMD